MNSLVTVMLGCVERKKKNAQSKNSYNENIPFEFSYLSKASYFWSKCTICHEKILYLFKFIRFSMSRYTHYKWVNWWSSAILPWKKYFLYQRWLGLAVMGKYHSKLLMLFNPVFQMKCKYYNFMMKFGYFISRKIFKCDPNLFFSLNLYIKCWFSHSVNLGVSEKESLFWKF